jgi:hypothetical protein
MTAAAGPFETEAQARQLRAVRAVYDAMHASHRPGAGGQGCRELLAAACDGAGVQLGAYDRRILDWLAGYEPQACAVIAGIKGRPGRGTAGRVGTNGCTTAERDAAGPATARTGHAERDGRTGAGAGHWQRAGVSWLPTRRTTLWWIF